MDVAAEFSRYCGPSVKFEVCQRDGRTITIEYSIPAISTERRRVIAHLRNGLEIVLRRVVRQMAASASADAYRATGNRDADMAKLLRGKVLCALLAPRSRWRILRSESGGSI